MSEPWKARGAREPDASKGERREPRMANKPEAAMPPLTPEPQTMAGRLLVLRWIPRKHDDALIEALERDVVAIEQEAARLTPAMPDSDALRAALEREIHHAEDNGHLITEGQGIAPGEGVPGVRIDYLRAALVASPADPAMPDSEALRAALTKAIELSIHELGRTYGAGRTLSSVKTDGDMSWMAEKLAPLILADPGFRDALADAILANGSAFVDASTLERLRRFVEYVANQNPTSSKNADGHDGWGYPVVVDLVSRARAALEPSPVPATTTPKETT
jgi:hypothetical protein